MGGKLDKGGNSAAREPILRVARNSPPAPKFLFARHSGGVLAPVLDMVQGSSSLGINARCLFGWQMEDHSAPDAESPLLRSMTGMTWPALLEN